LVSKPSICGFGLNWQHSARMAFVGVTDSFESYYQAVRRCWRFGQKRDVHVHVFASSAEGAVVANLRRKERDAMEMADNVITYRVVVKEIASKFGVYATFMPKPIFGDNGSGMHTHISLWKEGHPLFAGTGYAGLSELGLYAIGGILRHAPALLALTNPTTNSYKRLVPGYEAPVNLAYSQRNRSAACRIPMYSTSPKAKRVEFRCPDPTCNPYLSFAAILMAVIDGIQNKLHPGDPLDRDIYDMPPEELAGVPKAPASLAEACDCLAADSDFLLRGDVFTDDVITTWLKWKREREVAPMRLRPHPYEFCLYFDA
jgi:glutamine synthetase